jgi:periplasmic protein CpxP/Spy
MKKKTILLSLVLLCTSVAVMAQPGGGRGQRRTVEERVKMIHEKLDSAFSKSIPADKFALVDSAFASFYRAQDKMREEMMAGGGPPDEAAREAMRAKMTELTVERDEKLQKVFTEAQYKKWKDEVEPALRPRRGPGGGPGGPGGGGQ